MVERKTVGIAGLPGAGKTTLVHRLAEALGDATAVHLDAYERVTERSFEDILDWVRRGADCDELDIPGLAEDLAALRAGNAVSDPRTGATLRPARYVLLETLYGREHRASGRQLDLLVWLEVAPDVALARTLKGMVDTFAGEPDPGARAEGAAWLGTYLETYLAGVHRALSLQRERVPKGADVVVDGAHPPEALARALAGAIREKLG